MLCCSVPLLTLRLLPRSPFSYFFTQLIATHLTTFSEGITSLPRIPSNLYTWAVLTAPYVDLDQNNLLKVLFSLRNHALLEGKD